MLVLEIREPSRALRRVSFTRYGLGMGRAVPSLSIGRSSRVDVVLESLSVSDFHVELVEREGLLELVPAASVVIDGQALQKGPRVVSIGSVIEIADCTVVVTQFVPIVPADFESSEKEFLELTRADRSDVGARLVYADALEEGGWLIRGEYLRVQVRLLLRQALEGDADAYARFTRKLAPARRWLASVATPVLGDRCSAKVGRECPARWAADGPPSICWKCQVAVRVPTTPRA